MVGGCRWDIHGRACYVMDKESVAPHNDTIHSITSTVTTYHQTLRALKEPSRRLRPILRGSAL